LQLVEMSHYGVQWTRFARICLPVSSPWSLILVLCVYKFNSRILISSVIWHSIILWKLASIAKERTVRNKQLAKHSRSYACCLPIAYLSSSLTLNANLKCLRWIVFCQKWTSHFWDCRQNSRIRYYAWHCVCIHWYGSENAKKPWSFHGGNIFIKHMSTWLLHEIYIHLPVFSD
jgi:hypothetical protein